MSGYLEVKYPSKSSLGLNPFKSWKRQWCILRPSGMSTGGSLAVYCSEAGATAGFVALPSGGIVRRTKSRSRAHAFAVFTADGRKPCVLLAAHNQHDAQMWMEKIRNLITEDVVDPGSIKDSYSVSIVPTELSRKCCLHSDGTASVTPNGLLITKSQKLGAVVEWKHVNGVKFDSKTKMCTISVESEFRLGPGEIKLSTPLANELCAAIKDEHAQSLTRPPTHHGLSKDNEEASRGSWSSEPSEVSSDDIDPSPSSGEWATGGGAGSGVGPGGADVARHYKSFGDSMTDRRSLLSIASGIYEEIPDVPDESLYCKMGVHNMSIVGALGGPTSASGTPIMDRAVEPTYESVSECVYATMRRGKRYLPPPLPPRAPFGTMKPDDSWNSRMNQSPDTCDDKLSCVTRHSSLTSLPRCCSVSSGSSADAQPKRQAFSVFRKRLKSDSRIATSMKSDTSKENKHVDTKKKKFDFPPTKDFLKNFKVSRKMRNLKITGSLTNTETKSCEFLDETEHVATNRCSKSVECLELQDQLEGDFIEFNDDAVAALALPQEIVDIILRGREQVGKRRLQDDHSIAPSVVHLPPTPATIEHHYTVMSSHKSKIAQ